MQRVVMKSRIQAPACHLSWTVRKISNGLYAVAATSNGSDYDFVGNYRSLADAHRAGRLYARQLIHQTHLMARSA